MHPPDGPLARLHSPERKADNRVRRACVLYTANASLRTCHADCTDKRALGFSSTPAIGTSRPISTLNGKT